MRKFCLFLNFLFFVISCVSFYLFMQAYFNLTGQGAPVGDVLVSALLIHLPFIAQLGGAVASLFPAVSAFKLNSVFAKAWLSVILIFTLVITAITSVLYFGLIM